MLLNIDEADQSHFSTNYGDIKELSNSFQIGRPPLTNKSQFDIHQSSQIIRSQSVVISPVTSKRFELENSGPQKKATLEDVAASQQRLKEISNHVEEEDAHSATHLFDSDDSNSQATNSTFLNLQRSQQHNILLQSDNSNSNSGIDSSSQLNRST